MKIALIGQKGIPAKQGGIERHVEELSIRLAEAGFDVSVYSRPHYLNQNIKKYKGVKLINLPSLNTKNLDAISHTFLSTIHALFQNYDIIHYHGVGPTLLSWIPRILKPKTKVVATFHCLDRKHQKWNWFAKLMLALGERAACKFPHQTITVSKTLKKYCEYRFDKSTSYIPNGVSLGENKSNTDILKEYNLSKDNYIFTASRLVKHKGIHTLIKAYNKIKTSQKLVIAGEGSNTYDYVKELRQLAAGNKNIIFVGEQTGGSLKALFENAYLFVQPSEAEGLSIALLESISYGLPTIISNIEENMEVASDLTINFKNKSVSDLAKKLEFALSNGSEIKNNALLAKKIIDKEYDWNNIINQTVGLYKQPFRSIFHQKLAKADIE
ncbi:MAG: glycosyltransferase family 4 protein [Candidatus Buchananbacteria bacterium]|nr:glycosyltransferase family 4 protein [Candidatus Buchananbacteria bacterium]